MNHTALLKQLNACPDALDWYEDRASQTAWHECERGDWLLWVAAQINIDRTLLISAACDCAETGLKYVPVGDDRPRLAMETARRWVRGEVSSEEAVMQLLRDYRCRLGVIDRGPELHTAQRIRDTMAQEGITVWLCGFHPGAKTGAGEYAMTLKTATQEVLVDRTGAFDAAFADIRRGDRVWPEDVTGVAGWLSQMQAPVRKLSPKGDRYIWTKTDEADHYRLADVYQRVASDLVGRGGVYLSG